MNNIFERFQKNDLFKTLEHRGVDLSPARIGKTPYVLTDTELSNEDCSNLGKVISSIDDIPRELIPHSVFYIYFICDSDALYHLKIIKKYGGIFVPHLNYDKTEYRFIDKRAYLALKKTWSKAERVSHLNPIVHENICEALCLTQNISGDYVEIGVYLGGSALTAMHYLESQIPSLFNRKAWLIDTFEGFNYVEATDSPDLIWNNTHALFGVTETIAYIQKTFAGIDIDYELIQQNILRQPLNENIKNIAVANIDVDMYEPTLAALHACAARLSDGGILICEDPSSTPGLYGAYMAMHEFLDSDSGKDFVSIFKGGQYFLMRK